MSIFSKVFSGLKKGINAVPAVRVVADLLGVKKGTAVDIALKDAEKAKKIKDIIEEK